MSRQRKNQTWWQWWQTLPGVLTATAGIITAVTGLVVALNQSSLFAPKERLAADPMQKAKIETVSNAQKNFVVGNAPNALFVDNFSEDRLDARWRIVNHNPGKTTVQPKKGTLLIVTEKGSIARNSTNLRNQYVLDLALPNDNYELIVKASFQVQSTYNGISVGLFKDDDNFLELIYWGRPASDKELPDGVDSDFYRTLSFSKEELGKRTGFSTPNTTDMHGPNQAPWHFLFKLERTGNEYNGYYARYPTERPPDNLDSVRWIKLGTHAWIDFDGKVSLWARNGNARIRGQGWPRETAAEFDFVMVRKK